MLIRDDFAGPGGWDEGLKLLGIVNDVVGIEIDSVTCETARAAGHERICADVRAVSSSAFGDLDGYIASPPCQTFSTAGAGAGRAALGQVHEAAVAVMAGRTPAVAVEALGASALDVRTVLALEPLRVVAELRPRWVALEQVPPARSVWEVFAVLLRAVGYHVVVGALSAERFGVPQVRRRAVLLAHRDRPVSVPMPSHSAFYPRDPGRFDPGVFRWLSMADGLGWSRHADLDGSPPWASRFADQSGTPVNPWWPALRPSTTVAGRGMVQNPGATANRFNGSTKSRNDGVRIEPHEGGVLQSFRADYPWRGNISQRYTQAGDAVPPRLAAAVLAGLVAP